MMISFVDSLMSSSVAVSSEVTSFFLFHAVGELLFWKNSSRLPNVVEAGRNILQL